MAERRAYWPALDGLRALALGLVVAHHLRTELLIGGDIGVDLFFTLSGFLITSVLIAEWQPARTIGFRRFYIRRFLRLGPALGLMLVFAAVVAVTTSTAVRETLTQIPFAATYTLNWVFAYVGGPGTPASLVAPAWSLAVEEQFYLVWPVAFFVMLRRWSPTTVAWATASAAVLLMAVNVALFAATGDADRIYYATEARLPQLLAGCVVAIAFAFGKLDRLRRPFAGWVALGSAAVVLVFAQNLITGYQIGYWRMPVVTLLAAAIVWGMVVAGDSPALWVFTLAPVRWIGRLSYGIYLFHWPILETMRSKGLAPSVVALVGIPLAVAAAMISWRFVETPALRLKSRFEPPVGAAAPSP